MIVNVDSWSLRKGTVCRSDPRFAFPAPPAADLEPTTASSVTIGRPWKTSFSGPMLRNYLYPKMPHAVVYRAPAESFDAEPVAD
jgi:hypothetical protein